MPQKNEVNQTTEPSPLRLSARSIIIIFILLFVGTSAVVAYISVPDIRLSRLLTVGVIFIILGLALVDHLVEAFQKEQVWRQLANRTGLICRVDSFFLLGYTVHVTGIYRGRSLTMFSFKQGKSQVPSTQIELVVNNKIGATLRLRGPFKADEAMSDRIISQMFEAAEARQFGDNQRFFIRSRPVHLITTMFRPGSLRTKLLQLENLVNIELEGQTLYLNQLGVLGDIEYLHCLFDLLSDLAEAIEGGGYIRLTSSAN